MINTITFRPTSLRPLQMLGSTNERECWKNDDDERDTDWTTYWTKYHEQFPNRSLSEKAGLALDNAQRDCKRYLATKRVIAEHDIKKLADRVNDKFIKSYAGHTFERNYFHSDHHYPKEVCDFDGAKFKYADFGHETFKNRAGFAGARFEYGASFNTTTFENGADFSNAIFKGEADFYGADFAVDVDFDFRGAQFNKELSFMRSTLGGNFNGCKFSGDVDFRGAKFTDDVNFRDALFEGPTVKLGELPLFKFGGLYYETNDDEINIAELKNVFKGAKIKKGTEIHYCDMIVNPKYLGMIEVE